jgi:hypothetical protein
MSTFFPNYYLPKIIKPVGKHLGTKSRSAEIKTKQNSADMLGIYIYEYLGILYFPD